MSDDVLRVLIVEDEPIILRHTMRKVAELGENIKVVSGVENAEAALSVLENQEVDILLTDIEMGETSGLELIQITKKEYPLIRTIILSGYDNFEYAQTALRYGAYDYLLKPISTQQLEEIFSKLQAEILQMRYSSSKTPQLSPIDNLSLPEQIERFIVERYNQNITMSDISDRFNYAPSYISRVFKKEYNTSPMQYQTNLRIEKAKEILKVNPTINIKTIATEVGYDDARYFSRVFRQATGTPPSAWIE